MRIVYAHAVTARGTLYALFCAARRAARPASANATLTPPTPCPATSAPLQTQARCAASTATSAPRAARTPATASARATPTSWHPPSAGTAAVRFFRRAGGAPRAASLRIPPLPLLSFPARALQFPPRLLPHAHLALHLTHTLLDASLPSLFAAAASNTAAGVAVKLATRGSRAPTEAQRGAASFAERMLAEKAGERAR